MQDPRQLKIEESHPVKHCTGSFMSTPLHSDQFKFSLYNYWADLQSSHQKNTAILENSILSFILKTTIQTGILFCT